MNKRVHFTWGELNKMKKKQQNAMKLKPFYQF